MNTSHLSISLASCLLFITVNASEVGTLTQFQSNTTAKASEVNDNFTALTTSINDNNNRLNAIETPAIQTGYLSIPQHALHIKATQGCEQATTSGYTYITNSSTSDSCTLMTSLTLPDNATITEVICSIKNNDATTTSNPTIYIGRVGIDVWSIDTLVNGSLTADDASVQKLVFQTVNNATVDTQNYAYFLEFYPKNTTTANSNQAFYNCQIKYEY